MLRSLRLSARLALGLGLALALLFPSVASAAGKRPVTVTAVLSVDRVLQGDAVRITGRAGPSPTGTTVLLQRYRSGAWKTIAKTRTGSRGAYAFSERPPEGRARYRVVRPSDARYAAGTSPAVRTRAEACRGLPLPMPSTAAWFTRTGASSTSQLARKLGGLFCTAAPGSTVQVAMYFVRTGDSAREVETILRPLELMHRYRGVRVQFLLERRVYAGGGMDSTLRRLRSFATVEFCTWSCRNANDASGILHDKFVVMSNTTLRPGKDPVVVTSSANWSYSQLRGKWQSAVLSHDDPVLARELAIRWDALRACGTPGGCEAWTGQYAGAVLPGEYGTSSRGGISYDGASVRPGGAGRGTAVQFSPIRTGDPVRQELTAGTCSAEHRTVRLAMFKFTSGRSAVADALAAMQQAGCDVSIALATPVDTVERAGLDMLRSRGLQVSCVRGLHDKAVVLDVAGRDGAPRTTLMTGSANLTYSALRLSDEAQLQLTVQQASPPYAAALAQVHAAYLRNWRTMARAAGSCDPLATPAPPDPLGAPGVDGVSGADGVSGDGADSGSGVGLEGNAGVRLAPPGEPNTPDPEELG